MQRIAPQWYICMGQAPVVPEISIKLQQVGLNHQFVTCLPGSLPMACRSAGDPPGGRAKVAVKGYTLEVDIPRGPLFDAERVGTASFALVWNGTTAVWTLSALAAGSIIGAAFSLPFWFAGEPAGSLLPPSHPDLMTVQQS